MRSLSFVSLFVTLALLITLIGCGVPKSQHEAVLSEKAALQDKLTSITKARDALKGEFDTVLKEKAQLSAKVQALMNEVATLKEESTKLLNEIASLKAPNAAAEALSAATE